MITIAILEDGVPSGTFTADQIRAANPDCPEVEAALCCLEAGAYQVEMNLGAGGKTTFVVIADGSRIDDPEYVEVRASMLRPRRALASYRGTLADVRAASDRDVEVEKLRRQFEDLALEAKIAGVDNYQCYPTTAEIRELVDATEDKR